VVDDHASWELHQSVFELDGTLRDIYVEDTTLEDWKTVLEHILGGYPGARLLRWRDGESVEVPIPIDLESLFDGDDRWLLMFTIAELEVDCHFFLVHEIELSFAPEPATEASLRPLLAFIVAIGDAIGRDVIVTPENGPHAPYFRYRPTDQRLTWYPVLSNMP
jgi:hypothetical protein